jgi:hypothetical protein
MILIETYRPSMIGLAANKDTDDIFSIYLNARLPEVNKQGTFFLPSRPSSCEGGIVCYPTDDPDG